MTTCLVIMSITEPSIKTVEPSQYMIFNYYLIDISSTLEFIIE